MLMRNNLGYGTEILQLCKKMLNLKLRKFWGLTPTYEEVTRKKPVGGIFPPLP